MKIRKVLISAAAVVLAAVVALVLWLMHLDPKDIVALIERQAQLATGRALHIDGPVSLQWSLIPTVAVEGVRLQNAAWGSRPDMLSVKRAEVQLALVPLFSGEVKIRKIALDTPQVLLEVNGKGEQNWVFDSSKKDEAAQRKLSIDIAELRIDHGSVDYRPAAPTKPTVLRIDSLALKSSDADKASIDSKFVLDEMPTVLKGDIPSIASVVDGASSLPLDIQLESVGVVFKLSGKVTMGQGSLDGTDLKFSVLADDPAASARQLKIDLPHLPKAEMTGQARIAKSVLELSAVQIDSGRSKLRAELQMPLGKARVAVDAKIDAVVIDLVELLGPPPSAKNVIPSKDGRMFSDEPLPIAGLDAADARGDIKLARLVMRDGKTFTDASAHFKLDRGHLTLDPLRMVIDGQPLRMQIQADASSGKSLGVVASIDGKAIPLAGLAGLAGVSATPQGAPTDLALKLNAHGGSVRQLMATLDGDVRVVVGPGHWKGSAFELNPAVTAVLDVVLPSGGSGAVTELQCAVLRFPLHQGVAKVDNGIGVETSRIKLSANGTVDLRNETLDLGFHPKAVTGSNLSIGNLAQLVRVGGTLVAPKSGVDAAGVASTALDVGLSIATTGKFSGKRLLADNSPDNPCEVALGKPAMKSGAPQKSEAAPSTEKTVIDTLDAVRGLFGK